jgi:hypothetical protein
VRKKKPVNKQASRSPPREVSRLRGTQGFVRRRLPLETLGKVEPSAGWTQGLRVSKPENHKKKEHHRTKK